MIEITNINAETVEISVTDFSPKISKVVLIDGGSKLQTIKIDAQGVLTIAIDPVRSMVDRAALDTQFAEVRQSLEQFAHTLRRAAPKKSPRKVRAARRVVRK